MKFLGMDLLRRIHVRLRFLFEKIESNCDELGVPSRLYSCLRPTVPGIDFRFTETPIRIKCSLKVSMSGIIALVQNPRKADFTHQACLGSLTIFKGIIV